MNNSIGQILILLLIYSGALNVAFNFLAIDLNTVSCKSFTLLQTPLNAERCWVDLII